MARCLPLLNKLCCACLSPPFHLQAPSSGAPRVRAAGVAEFDAASEYSNAEILRPTAQPGEYCLWYDLFDLISRVEIDRE